jgi:hypothetical protein
LGSSHSIRVCRRPHPQSVLGREGRGRDRQRGEEGRKCLLFLGRQSAVSFYARFRVKDTKNARLFASSGQSIEIGSASHPPSGFPSWSSLAGASHCAGENLTISSLWFIPDSLRPREAPSCLGGRGRLPARGSRSPVLARISAYGSSSHGLAARRRVEWIAIAAGKGYLSSS